MKHILMSCATLLLLSGCGFLYQVGGAEKPSFDISKAAYTVPEFEFVNQEGEPFGSENLKGEHYLATLIFTHCPSVCPIMTPNMQRLQAAMLENDVDLQFIAFTVDPDRDTPEHLKQYGTNVGAELDTWNFLTGYQQDEIAEFSEEAFKMPVQVYEDNEDIGHSTSFFSR